MTGNLELFHSLLRTMVKKNTQIVETIREDLAEGRLQEMAARLHTQRGTLVNIGATVLSVQVLELVECLRDGSDTPG